MDQLKVSFTCKDCRPQFDFHLRLHLFQQVHRQTSFFSLARILMSSHLLFVTIEKVVESLAEAVVELGRKPVIILAGAYCNFKLFNLTHSLVCIPLLPHQTSKDIRTQLLKEIL